MKQHYFETVTPALQKKLGYANVWQLPRMSKVVVSVGLGPGLKDPKFTESAIAALRKITGQNPIQTQAKVSISNFKIRQGQVIGLKVTLRGERMYGFLQKFIHVTLPRVRDFRGVDPKSVDASGNLSIGMKENIAFPEITADSVERISGLEVTLVTTAKNRPEGLALLRQLGIPFRSA